MLGVLRSLNLQGDVSHYAQLLAVAGFRTFDDLLVGEPSLEELAVMGISNSSDRDAIYYEIFPEKALAAAGLTGKGNAVLSGFKDSYSEYDFDDNFGGVDGGGDDFGSNDFGSNDFGSNDFGSNDFGSNDFGSNDFGSNDFGSNDFGSSDFGGVGGGDFGSDDFGSNDFGSTDFGSNDFGGVSGISGGDGDGDSGLSPEELEIKKIKEELMMLQKGPPEPVSAAAPAGGGGGGEADDPLDEMALIRQELAALRAGGPSLEAPSYKQEGPTEAELEYERMQAELQALRLEAQQVSQLAAAPKPSEADEYAKLTEEYEALKRQMAQGESGGSGGSGDGDTTYARLQELMARQARGEEVSMDELAAFDDVLDGVFEKYGEQDAVTTVSKGTSLAPGVRDSVGRPNYRRSKSFTEFNSSQLPSRPQGRNPIQKPPEERRYPGVKMNNGQQAASRPQDANSNRTRPTAPQKPLRTQQQQQRQSPRPPQKPSPSQQQQQQLQRQRQQQQQQQRIQQQQQQQQRQQQQRQHQQQQRPQQGQAQGQGQLTQAQLLQRQQQQHQRLQQQQRMQQQQHQQRQQQQRQQQQRVGGGRTAPEGMKFVQGPGNLVRLVPIDAQPSQSRTQPGGSVGASSRPANSTAINGGRGSGSMSVGAASQPGRGHAGSVSRMVPVKGGGIQGVVLTKDTSALAQIEALKKLAAEGANLSFGSDLSIEVSDPQTVGKGSVTLFLVTLTTNMRQFSHLTFSHLEVRRRYSHFESLYNKIMAATNSNARLPKFPKKDFFGRTSASIISTRLAYFQMMLGTIAKDKGLNGLSCVVDFFDDSKMMDIKMSSDSDGNDVASLRRQTLTGRMKGNIKDKRKKFMSKKKDK